MEEHFMLCYVINRDLSVYEKIKDASRIRPSAKYVFVPSLSAWNYENAENVCLIEINADY